MKKVVLLLGLLTSSYLYGQGISKFKSNIAEVEDASGKKTMISCGCNFVYTDYRFFMDCDNKLVQYYLLPGSEFMDLGIIVFNDTGFMVDMSDTTGTAQPVTAKIDSTNLNNIGVVYRTYDAYKEMQFIQYVERDGVTLIKRDKTKIKFKYN